MFTCLSEFLVIFFLSMMFRDALQAQVVLDFIVMSSILRHYDTTARRHLDYIVFKVRVAGTKM
jgi:hypothetical protein